MLHVQPIGLLSEGVVVQVASRPFEAATASGTVEFDYGTIVVPMGVQHPDKFDEINELIQQIADEDAVTVYALESGFEQYRNRYRQQKF